MDANNRIVSQWVSFTGLNHGPNVFDHSFLLTSNNRWAEPGYSLTMQSFQGAPQILRGSVVTVEVESAHAVDLNINETWAYPCLLYTSPSPRDGLLSRMPSS